MYLTLTDEIKTLKEEKKRPEGNPTSPSNQIPTQDVRKQDKALWNAHNNINKAFEEVKRGLGGDTQGTYAPAPAPQPSTPHQDGKPPGVRFATGGHTQGIYAPATAPQQTAPHTTGNPMGTPAFSEQTHHHNNREYNHH